MTVFEDCSLSFSRRGKGRRPWVVSSALLLAAALLPASVPAVSAQAASAPAKAPQEESFYESLDVEVVSIEVFVTDKDGQPAAGLTKDDFELLADGKKVEITNFYAEQPDPQGAAPGETPETAETPEAGAATAAPGASASVSDDQRLYLTVLLDNRSLTGPARNRALQSIRGFLTANLKPEDRVMLAIYDGSLSIPQRPTSDLKAFEAAVDEALQSAPRGVEARSEYDLLLSQIASASIDGRSAEIEADSVYAAMRLYGARRLQDVKGTITMLKRFVGSLGGLPGRKVVLYVSEGLPLRPVETLLRAMEKKYQAIPSLNRSNMIESMSFDATSDLRSLIAAANASRVTFYALAAGSTEGSGARSGPVYTPDLVANERFNQTASLADMAGATGGFASIDASTPGPLLQQALRDFSVYYSLGYLSQPQGRRSDKSHRIQVRVKKPGLKVRHRENFVARTGLERTRDSTMAALLLGEPRNPLEVGVDFGEQTINKDGNVLVDVTVKFPVSKLVLLPTENFHQGRAWVFIATRDSHGRNSDVTQIAIPINVPNANLMTVMGQTAGYQTKLMLRPEPHQVVIGVRDDLGNTDSTMIADFTPDSSAAGAAKAP